MSAACMLFRKFLQFDAWFAANIFSILTNVLGHTFSYQKTSKFSL